MIIHVKAPKGVAFTLVTPVYDGEWSTQYISGAAGLDSEISKDKASFADCTNELTEIDTTGIYYLDLTVAEMNADVIVIKATSTTSGANIPLFVIHTMADNLEVSNTELASVPDTTSSLHQMVQFLFELFRNKVTMNKDTGVETLYKEDSSTVLGTRTHTDDGTTWTKPEMS